MAPYHAHRFQSVWVTSQRAAGSKHTLNVNELMLQKRNIQTTLRSISCQFVVQLVEQLITRKSNSEIWA